MPDAGRVIAGTAKGIRLRAPGAGTRPFADRVKQTLFAILEPELDGARVLDLFAGSGAGGIEALSRGAAAAIFVEKDQGAAAVIDANLRATGLAGPATAVIRWDVVRWLGEAPTADRFDLVLAGNLGDRHAMGDKEIQLDDDRPVEADVDPARRQAQPLGQATDRTAAREADDAIRSERRAADDIDDRAAADEGSPGGRGRWIGGHAAGILRRRLDPPGPVAGRTTRVLSYRLARAIQPGSPARPRTGPNATSPTRPISRTSWPAPVRSAARSRWAASTRSRPG